MPPLEYLGVNRTGDTEISDIRMVVGEQDILGLHIAVEHLPLVSVGEGGRYTACDLKGFFQRQLTIPYEPIPQRPTPDVWHHVERVSGCLPRIVQSKDVVVLQPRRIADLLEELIGSYPADCFGRDDLHCH